MYPGYYGATYVHIRAWWNKLNIRTNRCREPAESGITFSDDPPIHLKTLGEMSSVRRPTYKTDAGLQLIITTCVYSTYKDKKEKRSADYYAKLVYRTVVLHGTPLIGECNRFLVLGERK